MKQKIISYLMQKNFEMYQKKVKKQRRAYFTKIMQVNNSIREGLK